jgi:hypothetical protein
MEDRYSEPALILREIAPKVKKEVKQVYRTRVKVVGY